MGYRSRGRWVITGPADKVATAWAAARLEVPPYKPEGNVFDSAGFSDFKFYTIEDRGYIRFEFDDWKWYSNYPSIQFYERVWDYLSETDGLSGKRVHIGDDNAVDESEFGDEIIELFAHCDFADDEPQPPTKE